MNILLHDGALLLESVRVLVLMNFYGRLWIWFDGYGSVFGLNDSGDDVRSWWFEEDQREDSRVPRVFVVVRFRWWEALVSELKEETTVWKEGYCAYRPWRRKMYVFIEFAGYSIHQFCFVGYDIICVFIILLANRWCDLELLHSCVIVFTLEYV